MERKIKGDILYDLLQSSGINKPNSKILGDELICYYPYLLDTENMDNKEFNLKIDELLTCRNSITDEEFGWYLAGLLESDGHCTGNNIGISFNIYDTNLAVYIRDRIGEGNIYKHIGNSSVIYFYSKDSIRKIIEITNGKFYSNYKIEYMKKHDYESRFNIKLLPPVDLKSNCILDNPFLAGFSDGDSCFDISFGKNYITPRYRIAQKDTTIINILKETIGGNIYQSKNRNYKDYEVTNKEIILKYVKYFEKYKLLSTKYINYILWKKIIELKKSQKSITEEEKEKILNIKNCMNSQLYKYLKFSKKSE